MSQEEWERVSRTIDFILKQPTGGAVAIKGEPPKKQRKPKKPKQEPPAEQLRMF
jgi:hypothetical protein